LHFELDGKVQIQNSTQFHASVQYYPLNICLISGHLWMFNFLCWWDMSQSTGYLFWWYCKRWRNSSCEYNQSYHL